MSNDDKFLYGMFAAMGFLVLALVAFAIHANSGPCQEGTIVWAAQDISGRDQICENGKWRSMTIQDYKTIRGRHGDE